MAQQPQSSDCPSSETLTQLLDGTLADAQQWEPHLQECVKCQDRLDAMSQSPVLQPFRKDEPFYAPGGYSFLDLPLRDGDLGALAGMFVEREIGRGGMGVVFRAYEPKLERLVAIKVLTTDGSSRAESRFEREAIAVGRIRNDHVLRVYAIGRTCDQRPYLVMPLIQGATLKQVLSEKRLSDRRTVEIIRDVALGLAAAEKGGIIHRDVKPSNILIDHLDGRAKLTDFGLAHLVSTAKLTEQVTLFDGIYGTPEYMSPEQVVAEQALTPASDVYSLGVTMYECLTGSTPFRGQPLQVLQLHHKSEPVPPRKLDARISRDLETICLKALAKHPSHRYESAQRFADDLQRYLDGHPIRARPVRALQRLVLWSRRNSALAAALALVFLLMATGTVVSSVMWQFSSHNAQLAIQRAKLLEVSEADLKASNEHLRSALDGFFGRFIHDELFRVQLSPHFHNQMIEDLLDYYDVVLAQHSEDRQLTMEVCSQVTEVVKHALESEFAIQAYRASRWNLKKMEPWVSRNDATADELTQFVEVQLLVAESHSMRSGWAPNEPFLDPRSFSDKLLANAVRAVDQGGGPWARRHLIYAHILRNQHWQEKRRATERLKTFIDEIDALAAEHPELPSLLGDCSQIRRMLAEQSGPEAHLRLRREAIEILQQRLKLEKSTSFPGIWIRRKIATSQALLIPVLQQLGRKADEDSMTLEAIESYEKLLADVPSFLQVRMDLAEVYVLVAESRLSRQERAAAFKNYNKAIQQFYQLAGMSKGQVNALRRASQIHEKIADFSKGHDPAQMCRSMDSAVEDYRRIFLEPVGHRRTYDATRLKQLLRKAADFHQSTGSLEQADAYRREAHRLTENVALTPVDR